jgi:flagellar motor switch protein FliN/FliY
MRASLGARVADDLIDDGADLLIAGDQLEGVVLGNGETLHSRHVVLAVGRAELTIRDLLRLSEGSVIELDRLAGDPLDVLVNGTLIAKGEVVMVGERFGIRFGQIIDPEKRAESI